MDRYNKPNKWYKISECDCIDEEKQQHNNKTLTNTLLYIGFGIIIFSLINRKK